MDPNADGDMTYVPARKTWADAVAASDHHSERARELLHEAGVAEAAETPGNYHAADRILLAARIHAELATAAAVRAQAAML